MPLVDVRTTKEYNERHIRGAMSIPYVEKSLKDVAFDAALDEWKGPDQLDRNRAAIFHCNGAECWKSYKAAKVALGKGFKTVYWFRGGFPEWESNGMPVESSARRERRSGRLARRRPARGQDCQRPVAGTPHGPPARHADAARARAELRCR